MKTFISICVYLKSKNLFTYNICNSVLKQVIENDGRFTIYILQEKRGFATIYTTT